ncbi:MAG: hypothetical protein LPK45_05915 [Bacteroidota bacterium]|nr:hypothetical protein [Bacteroidota bacterium]MDX5430603.1 hypothetical protein [Bacteroidota bacterium]MDX5469355.1 hypothetical protein [Bacteroidota bacterium]
MKRLHHLDAPVQGIFFLAGFVCLFFQPGISFMILYGVIGFWQALLALIFAFDDEVYRGNSRKLYEKVLVGVLIAGLISLVAPEIRMVYLLLMLVVGFIMAVWNLTIAISEREIAQSQHQVWDIS